MGIDILVVDDDADMRMTLVELLADEGYSVQELSSARALVDDIEARRPRLVLLDLTMPGFDVARTAEEMADRGVLRSCRVIALSGLDRSEELAAQFGFHGALPKPFQIDDLLATVERALSPGAAESTHAENLHT